VLRRDFGSIDLNHKPIGGYAQPLQYLSESVTIPKTRRALRLPVQAVCGIVQATDEFPSAEELQGPEGLGNETLPIFPYKQEITDAVKGNSVTIVVGETGSGKSTQLPQFLLDAGWNRVFLTQPRRSATYNVFDRIRTEIGEKWGKAQAAELVSFQTAGNREGPEGARIKIQTDGLRLASQFGGQATMKGDVLVIDEVHEWNTNVEIMVATVKEAVAKNPDLRVVIMSATMEADRMANYFADACRTVPPIIEVPGRVFPVERIEKPESTVVDEVLLATEAMFDERTGGKLVDGAPNGILTFVAGKQEIGDAIDEIRRRLPKDLPGPVTILPLHAKLPLAEQQATFRAYPGVKIIVSTNTAQTSLTIPDIRYVIDSGDERRMELDDEGVQGLVVHPISQADCDQRAGRTGRVCEGTYILTRMNPKRPFSPYMSRDKYPMAEILRTDIVRNTLRVASIGRDMAELDLYHPVDQTIIARAKKTLQTLGALDESGTVTDIGHRMNRFPVNAASARMMVESARYSANTRAYMAAIVAATEVGGLQYFAPNVGRGWKELTNEDTSDLLAQLEIFLAIQGKTTLEMKDYDLDVNNVLRAREQYRKIAKQASALTETLEPPTQAELDDIRQCIYAGSVNAIYKYAGDKKYQHITNGSPTLREISNRSVVSNGGPFVVGDPYRVVVTRGVETVERHILERVTRVSAADIGRAAAGLTTWHFEGFAMRDGKYVEVQRQRLGKIDLGVTREVIADPSPRLRELIIDHALENPGRNQSELRAIKKRLEELAHLAKDPVPQLSHDSLVALVREATPEDITDPARVDDYLRQLVQARGITLDALLPPDVQARIIADAPTEAEANGVTLSIKYRRGTPTVSHYTFQDIALLGDEEIQLADGRQIVFMYKPDGERLGKACSLPELRYKLGIR
jgi:ATP-dependent helicase HrpA